MLFEEIKIKAICAQMIRKKMTEENSCLLSLMMERNKVKKIKDKDAILAAVLVAATLPIPDHRRLPTPSIAFNN